MKTTQGTETHETSVRKGETGYLSPCDPKKDDLCLGVGPSGSFFPYLCTRAMGHDGDHAAHGDVGEQFARWPREVEN